MGCPCATFTAGVTARMVCKYVPHYGGGDGEKMAAILPLDVLLIYQTQISLVNKRRGLQSVPRVLAAHMRAGQPLQLWIYQRNQFLKGGLVAFFPIQQELCDFSRERGHERRPLSRKYQPTEPFKKSSAG